jgi:hypothetical protein
MKNYSVFLSVFLTTACTTTLPSVVPEEVGAIVHYHAKDEGIGVRCVK